ncbi:MAG: PqqD family protein [Acutalibacteraceae bacterium]|nr:PqqD family protein [Acutalibacteraceae bacterium]
MKKQETNYLDKIPVHPEGIPWKADENGIVTLEIENKGVMNRIAQKLFKRPKISYIHLDKTGSFVWPLIDGKKSITDLAAEVDAEFGEEAHPLYERLVQFFRVLDSYKFISWVE